MTVHSPKTEHHLGKGERVVPIFPELRPDLDELFAAATKGFEQTVNPDDWVLPSFRRDSANDGNWRGVNLRTQFEKILQRAGVTPWPRLWHNRRASRQTELEEQFPSHVVCVWLENSEAIARKHYLQVREVDFPKAARIPARGTPECASLETHGVTTNAKTPGNPRVLAVNVGDTGFDSPTQEIAVTSRVGLELWQSEQVAAESGGAESGAVDADNVVLSVPDDRRLLGLSDVWPMLTDDSRDAIARLAGFGHDDPDDVPTTLAGKAESR